MLADLRKPGARLLARTALAASSAIGPMAHAQSIEPRVYSPAPVGVNFLLVAYADSRGGLSFDDASPLENPQLHVQGPIFAYARSFGLAGQLAKLDVILPTGRLSGSADYLGQRVEREVRGAGDPLARLSVSLYGTPALDTAAFRSYRQDLIIGASLQVSAPLGQYDPDRLLNLGTNRWSFHPEVGLSQAFGPWMAEFAAGATFYTTNDNFFGGHRRSQEPLYSGRANLIYNFRAGQWISLDSTFYTGGQTTLDGQRENNLQRNSRLGTTLAVPVNRRVSVKFNASRGVSARTGNNYDLVGVALQYRWGGGL